MADTMTMDEQRYPMWICKPCGAQFGRRTVGAATWHAGRCGLCGGAAFVTQPCDFGGLKTALPGDKAAHHQRATNKEEH